ncbi:MAG: LysR family transcriptional regulator [Bryobacteraceae bacterium]
MHIDDVRTFVTVVETGSISVAARELHLTQPAVSRRVQRFEGVLGSPLIDRRRRPFALTHAGRAAFERCRRFLSMADELKAVGDGGVVPARELRIGVAHALTELALTEPLDEVRRAFPAAILRLHTGWSRDLLARVKTGALDAGVILMAEHDGPPAGVTSEPIAREDLVIVAPRTWPRRSYTVRELRAQPWILNPEGCAARSELRRQLARAQMPLPIGVETYNYELQLRLIARGRGIGLVPNRLLMRSPARPRLRRLHVRELRFPQLIWMVSGELAAGLDEPLIALRRALVERLCHRGRR